MSDTAGCRPIVVSGDAHRVRGRLGPVAWLVLEELVARSTATDNDARRHADGSCRSLGMSLGVDKDTVGRALGRLCAEGLVSTSQSRRSGRFAGSVYEVVVPAGLSVVPDVPIPVASPTPDDSDTTTPAHRSPRRPVRARTTPVCRPVLFVDHVEQLSLLEL